MERTNCGQIPEQDSRKVWASFGLVINNSAFIRNAQSCSTLSTTAGTTSPHPGLSGKPLKTPKVFCLSTHKFFTHQSSTIFTGA